MKLFVWIYYFFWGFEDVEGVYFDIWKKVVLDVKSVGFLLLNDVDGNVWLDMKSGFLLFIILKSLMFNNLGVFFDGMIDYMVQILVFKLNNDFIFLGVLILFDFMMFWKQVVQQGYYFEVVMVVKVILFFLVVSVFGKLGNNFFIEVWWVLFFFYKSLIIGQSLVDYVVVFIKLIGKQWIQLFGYVEVFFEVLNGVVVKVKMGGMVDI